MLMINLNLTIELIELIIQFKLNNETNRTKIIPLNLLGTLEIRGWITTSF